MAADASIPQWATDKRTLKTVSIVSGVALGALIAIVALVDPRVPPAVVNVIFVPAILVAVVIALPVIGLRMLFVRDKAQEEIPLTRLLIAYVLSALPIGLATLLLGALTTVAFVFNLETAPALAASIVALLGVWVFFSLTVKVVANLQLLLRHFAKP
jgi:hypothetical protein